ncbi:MAG: YIP1 family protein [Saprospiraceae bacterium]|nr:YIP1 family protein [Saprospiraceae bacterium]
MENHLLDEMEREYTFTDQEIFTKIWTRPRAVLQYVHDFQYEKFVAPLLVLAGIARAFDRAADRGLGDSLSLIALIITCLISGGLLGWLSYYIYAALVSWTGKWLNAHGDTASILRVIAYAMIPAILALALLAVQIGIYGIEVFKADGDIYSGGITANIIFYGSAVLEIILGITSLVFCVIGVSIVQQLSTAKTILNLLLPILIFLGPILLIAFLIGSFGG